MLELNEAVERILAALPSPREETVPLHLALDRVLSKTIISNLNLPAFDNSAMDGYALRAADVANASAENPVTLNLVGRIEAGKTFSGKIARGECVRLFTGSMIPEGADAVVMQEDTRLSERFLEKVFILDRVAVGENIRPRGGDVSVGQKLAETGAAITPGVLALLAATGLSEVAVNRQPIVAVLATGSELREPGQPLAPGQIYESNRLMLASLIQNAGGVPEIFPIVPDTLDETQAALEPAFATADIVITCGGASVGEMDFVKAAFEKLGGRLEFWKVAMRPGKPFIFGRCAEKFLFGLPGNPVSAFVTYLLLARPAIKRWQGAAEIFLPTQTSELGETISNPGERRHFVRVQFGNDGKIYSSGQQASHALSSLAAAAALLEVEAGKTFAAGDRVRILRVN